MGTWTIRQYISFGTVLYLLLVSQEPWIVVIWRYMMILCDSDYVIVIVIVLDYD